MPCYDPPITWGESRRGHEDSAMRILRKLNINFTDGPNAVRLLCRWCNNHTPAEIKAAEARWFWEDHQKFDLRRSGLAKLTKAEIKALGLRDEDNA